MNEELKFFLKIRRRKKRVGGGGRVGGLVGESGWMCTKS